MHAPLSIRGDGKEIYVQGLSEYNVKRVGDTLQLLKLAEKNRAVRETHMNQASSRSHSIFTINVEYKKVDLQDGGGEVSYKAKFNLVDLAGSEKWDTNRSMGAAHIAEMTKINLSLHSLGKCIAALAKASRRRNKEQSFDRSSAQGDDNSSLGKSVQNGLNTTSSSNNVSATNKYYGNIHVPYRESKLTRLLEDSLGGNSKTIMIATISPARFNCNETISTLKFADRAKQVMIQATINEFRPVDHAVVKRLQQENELLKVLVRKLYEESGFSGSLRQVIASPTFESLGLVQQLPPAILNGLASPGPAASLTQRRQQQDISTSMSQFPASQTSPSLPNSPAKKAAQSSQSLASNGVDAANQESRLEYILSLERALNKEQVHAQHLSKKNETLIKELEAMKLMNMQLACPPSGAASMLGGNVGASTGANHGQMAEWCATVMQIPETVVGDLNTSVMDMVRHNEELVAHTDQLQKVMQKFFKFQIEEDEMKRDVLAVFEVIKRLKGYVGAQRVNEHFQALQSLQETLERLKAEVSQHQQGHGHKPGGAAAWSGVQLQPLSQPSAPLHQQHHYQQQHQQQHQYAHSSMPASFAAPQPSMNRPPSSSHSNVWSPPIDSRSTSASNNTSSRVSSAAQFSAPPPAKHQPMFSHQDFDFYDEQSGAFAGPSGGMAQQQQQYHNHHHQQQHQHMASQSQRHRQLAPLSDSMQAQQPPHWSPNNSQQDSGGGGISFRVRQGPGAANKPQQSYQLPASMLANNQRRHGGSSESVGSAETMLGGLAILESEEEIMAREYKEAKARQKKKDKLAQWMKEKEERAKAEQRQQDEERKAMLDAEREREAKRKEYVQKQKAKLNNYHDKVKQESEKIQELINLGIDPKSLNL
jgi:hypothetical protein